MAKMLSLVVTEWVSVQTHNHGVGGGGGYLAMLAHIYIFVSLLIPPQKCPNPQRHQICSNRLGLFSGATASCWFGALFGAAEFGASGNVAPLGTEAS